MRARIAGCRRQRRADPRRRWRELPAPEEVLREPRPLAEVVPLPEPTASELEHALSRALDPRRLLLILASHASSRSATSWRAALALLQLQAQQRSAVLMPEPVKKTTRPGPLGAVDDSWGRESRFPSPQKLANSS
jgi:hypothetical protein